MVATLWVRRCISLMWESMGSVGSSFNSRMALVSATTWPKGREMRRATNTTKGMAASMMSREMSRERRLLWMMGPTSSSRGVSTAT